MGLLLGTEAAVMTPDGEDWFFSEYNFALSV